MQNSSFCTPPPDLVAYSFFVIVVTVIVYGLTAAPVARLLGLAKPGTRGFLFFFTCGSNL